MPLGIRNQSGFATHQSAASCFAAVAGLRVLGYRAGHRRSRSGVAGRRIGGPEPVGRIFQPSTDNARRFLSPVNSEQVSPNHHSGKGRNHNGTRGTDSTESQLTRGIRSQ